MQTYEARKESARRELQEGRYSQAVESLESLLQEQPSDILMRDDFAFCLSRLGRHQDAARQYSHLSQLTPASGVAQHNLGLALQRLGLSQKAIACFQRAQQLDQGLAEPCQVLADIYRKQGRSQEAIECYQQVLLRRPESAETHHNLACLCGEIGRYEMSIQHFQAAVKLRPDWAELHYNYALVLRGLGRIPEAMDRNQRAMELDPDFREARWIQCHLLLKVGRYQEAWAMDDWWRCHLKPLAYEEDPQVPLWQGESFVGRRLLVVWEQGFGDNLQFLRYLPRVKALGGTVIMEAPETMRGVLKGISGVDEWVTARPGQMADVPCDLYVPLLDLVRVFSVTLSSLNGGDVPYVFADREHMDRWRPRLQGPEFKVGLVWSGDPQNGNNKKRSCPLRDLLALTNIPNLKIYSLQKGAAAKDLEAYQGVTSLVNLGPELRDFSDTTAIIELLDLVITVDTAVLHLAGAMGKATWGLLCYAPDWRYMLERTDSPWYPSLRLFRQERPGDWSAPLDVVKTQLSALVRSR